MASKQATSNGPCWCCEQRSILIVLDGQTQDMLKALDFSITASQSASAGTDIQATQAKAHSLACPRYATHIYPGLVIDPAIFKEDQMRNNAGAGKADPQTILQICRDLGLQQEQTDKVAKFAELNPSLQLIRLFATTLAQMDNANEDTPGWLSQGAQEE